MKTMAIFKEGWPTDERYMTTKTKNSLKKETCRTFPAIDLCSPHSSASVPSKSWQKCLFQLFLEFLSAKLMLKLVFFFSREHLLWGWSFLWKRRTWVLPKECRWFLFMSLSHGRIFLWRCWVLKFDTHHQRPSVLCLFSYKLWECDDAPNHCRDSEGCEWGGGAPPRVLTGQIWRSMTFEQLGGKTWHSEGEKQ